jgi:hypothetical protein
VEEGLIVMPPPTYEQPADSGYRFRSPKGSEITAKFHPMGIVYIAPLELPFRH